MVGSCNEFDMKRPGKALVPSQPAIAAAPMPPSQISMNPVQISIVCFHFRFVSLETMTRCLQCSRQILTLVHR